MPPKFPLRIILLEEIDATEVQESKSYNTFIPIGSIAPEDVAK